MAALTQERPSDPELLYRESEITVLYYNLPCSGLWISCNGIIPYDLCDPLMRRGSKGEISPPFIPRIIPLLRGWCGERTPGSTTRAPLRTCPLHMMSLICWAFLFLSQGGRMSLDPGNLFLLPLLSVDGIGPSTLGIPMTTMSSRCREGSGIFFLRLSLAPSQRSPFTILLCRKMWRPFFSAPSHFSLFPSIVEFMLERERSSPMHCENAALFRFCTTLF